MSDGKYICIDQFSSVWLAASDGPARVRRLLYIMVYHQLNSMTSLLYHTIMMAIYHVISIAFDHVISHGILHHWYITPL
jgi:hypothetical protein